VKKKLIKNSPKHWELDDQLVHWIEFFTSFIAIFYAYEKHHDSIHEAESGEDFGHLYKRKHQEKYMNWQNWRKENAIFWKENDDDSIDAFREPNCD
jgi:hypothetical protein